MTKQELRNIVLKRLRAQSEIERQRKSAQILRELLKQKEFKKAKRIMFYITFAQEVDTQEMIKEARKQNKEIFIPICDSKTKTLTPCLFKEESQLRKGAYGVAEPAEVVPFSIDKLDLVIVPGLAFDKAGNRLGRGKGYYDRFLEHRFRKAPSIGLAFDFQILPNLTYTSKDARVDKILFA